MIAVKQSESLSGVRLFAAPRTVAHQALLSMEFSGQEHWSGLPFPPPGDLSDPGIGKADTLPSEPPRKPMSKTQTGKASSYI